MLSYIIFRFSSVIFEVIAFKFRFVPFNRKNIISKISALMVKKSLGAIKKDFDPSEHGGAPILGVAKPVIKAHGSSNAKAIRSAIRQAIQYVNSGISEDIAADAAAFAEKRKAAKKAESVSDETK